MRTATTVSLLSLVLLLAGCPGGTTPSDGGSMADAGAADAFVAPDAPTSDAPTSDAPTSDAGAPDAPPSACPPPPVCDAPLPALSPEASWRHSVATGITTAMGSARHRGRDLVLLEGDAQWALAKFAYGAADDDLKDEDVELWLDRGCGGAWELLSTVSTSRDGDHATVEGVEDTGGRVYWELPTSARLGLGRHRIVFVVRGDHSVAEQFIDVLPAGTRIVVTDVDGTQTSSETAAWASLLTGSGPDARPHGAEVLHQLQARGYHVFYITARPEWLEPRTREWLRDYGYPEGTVHTTLGGTGALGGAAETFKTEELAMLAAHVPGGLDWAIGNTDTDVAAYVTAGVSPDRLFSYQFDPGPGGTRVDDYASLLDDAAAEPIACH